MLRVKKHVKALQAIPKKIAFIVFYSFSLSNAKRLIIKAFLEVILVSLTLRAHIVLEKRKPFSCTGLQCNNKLAHFKGRNMASFTGNLVQNLMKLVSNSKSESTCPKMAKTKIIQTNAYMWLSEAKEFLQYEALNIVKIQNMMDIKDVLFNGL